MSSHESIESVLTEFMSHEAEARHSRRLLIERLLAAIHRERDVVASIQPATTKGRVGKDTLLTLLDSVGALYDEELIMMDGVQEKTARILTDLLFSLKSFKARHSERVN